jgi:hypothetical protein
MAAPTQRLALRRLGPALRHRRVVMGEVGGATAARAAPVRALERDPPEARLLRARAPACPVA